MSLQIWLPLNGNLNNQGISNVTITNNNSTVDNNGKFGKCYSFNGSNTHIRISMPSSMKSIKNSSIAVWVKSTSGTAAVGGISHDGGASLACMTLFSNNWQFVSGSEWKYISAGSYTNSGVWHHLACTVDDTIIRTYMDGALVTSSTLTALGVSVTDITSSNFIEIGCDHPGGDEMLTGLVNDFRVYDHCLSSKEIKEISKGLFLHYKLNNFGSNPNEIANGMPYGSVSGYSIAGTGWGSATLVANSVSPSGYVVRSTYTGSGNNSGGIHKQPYDYTALENGAVYTFSVWARASKSIPANINNELFTNMSPAMPVTLTTEWQHFVITGTINSSATYHSDIIYANGTNVTTNMWIEVYGLKLEKGSVATPWCPHTSDAQYTNFGFNSTSVKDISGFNNNGTITGTISYDSNTPRNSVCSYIADGSVSKITAPIFLNNDKCTMSMWVRSKNGTVGFNSYHIPFNIDAGQFEFSIDPNGKFRNGFYVNGTRYADTTPNPNIMDKNWHMITATFDGSNIKRYVDGVLVQTQAASGTLTGGSHTVYIGGPYGNTNNYYSKELYESDVRYYCTALSAEDIKDLYQSSANICNNGTLMAYEFIEN